MVIADLIRQGHDVAIPFGHNQPLDLIVIRKEDSRLEKVQVKYTTSDGKTVRAAIRSASAWVAHRYTADEIDWIVIYEATTSQCFYLPSSLWDGHTHLTLRMAPTANAQVKGIRWAEQFTRIAGDPRQLLPLSPAREPALQFSDPPE